MAISTRLRLIVTDLRPGASAATDTIRVIPRPAITRVELTEQLDPDKHESDLDPATRARQAGFIAGVAGHAFGDTSIHAMAGAVILNRFMPASGAPLTWQHVEVSTSLSVFPTLTCTFLCDRAAAHALTHGLQTVAGR